MTKNPKILNWLSGNGQNGQHSDKISYEDLKQIDALVEYATLSEMISEVYTKMSLPDAVQTDAAEKEGSVFHCITGINTGLHDTTQHNTTSMLNVCSVSLYSKSFH